MLEKLAKQTAVYGISTIAVRFLSYLLTPVFTRVFEPEGGALLLSTCGIDSDHLSFEVKAEGDSAAAGFFVR